MERISLESRCEHQVSLAICPNCLWEKIKQVQAAFDQEHARAERLMGDLATVKSELRDTKTLVEDIQYLCKAQGIEFQVFNCKNAGGPTP